MCSSDLAVDVNKAWDERALNMLGISRAIASSDFSDVSVVYSQPCVIQNTMAGDNATR